MSTEPLPDIEVDTTIAKADAPDAAEDFDVNAVLHDTETRIPVVQQLGITLGILLLIFGTSYIDDVLSVLAQKEKNMPAEQHHAPAAVPAARVDHVVVPEESVETDMFAEVHLEAQSAYVWDVREQRVLYNKDADTKLPLASITKLMTAMVAYELLEGTDAVEITTEALHQDGDSGLLGGETFSMQNLTDLTLITSSNDGAYALAAAAGASLFPDRNAEQTFVRAMNIRAEDIGLSQTRFYNTTGLDVSETQSGAYGSARDVTFLMEHIITTYPSLLESTREDFTHIANDSGAAHAAQNTNAYTEAIPGLIASKTGYTTLAGGNLVVAFDAGLNRPIIVSVLGSSREGRFRDVLALTRAARAQLVQ